MLAVVADVAKTEDCKKFIDAIAEHYGGQLDCVVLNAGVTTGDILEKLDLDAIHNLLDINIRGVVDTTYFSLPLLTKAPRPKIIGISSTAGIIGVPTRAPYAFSKFGMKGFLDALRNEYEHRIEITTIYPGPVRTDINRTRTGSQDLSWEGAMPLETAAKLIYDAAREGTMDLVFAPYTALKWIRDCGISFWGEYGDSSTECANFVLPIVHRVPLFPRHAGDSDRQADYGRQRRSSSQMRLFNYCFQ